MYEEAHSGIWFRERLASTAKYQWMRLVTYGLRWYTLPAKLHLGQSLGLVAERVDDRAKPLSHNELAVGI